MAYTYTILLYRAGSAGTTYTTDYTYTDNSSIIDNLDGSSDGYIAAGDQFTWDLFNTPATLLGTTDNGIVIDSNGSTLLLTDTAYAYGSLLSSFDDTGSVPFCFLEGTKVATPNGEVAIESLKMGDTVLTQDGREVAVKWMGYEKVQNRIGTRVDQAPVKISADAVAPGVPNADLYLTGSHAVMIDDLLINASVLCNGNSIEYVTLKDMPETFTYWHIETEDHEAVVANGLAAETFLDAPDRKSFDNYTQYVDTYGSDRKIKEMSNTRITAVRNLPETIKETLNISEVETDWAEILKDSSSSIVLKQAS